MVVVTVGNPGEQLVFNRTNVGDPNRYLQNQATLIAGGEVARRAAELLGDGTSASSIDQAVAAQPAIGLDRLTLRARSGDPDEAFAMVNAVAAAYEEVLEERLRAELTGRLDELRRAREALEQTARELDAAADPNSTAVVAQRNAVTAQLTQVTTLVEQLLVDIDLIDAGTLVSGAAEAPTAPVSPRPMRNVAVGVAAGLLLGVAVAWALAQRSPQVRDLRSIDGFLGIPRLGTVPQGEGLVSAVIADPDSQASFAVHNVMAHVVADLGTTGGTAAMATGADASTDVASITAAMAVAAQRSGRKVVVVDVDAGRRTLSHLADALERPGIEQGHLGDGNGIVGEWVLDAATAIDLVPLGSRSSRFLLEPGFPAALDELKKQYDLVLAAGPPLDSPAAGAAAPAVDGLVLVIRMTAPVAAVEDVLGSVRPGTPILGYVLAP